MTPVGMVRRTPGAVWRRIPDGVLVRVPGHASDALLLTGVTAEVWLELAEPRPRADLDTAATEALLGAGVVTATD